MKLKLTLILALSLAETLVVSFHANSQPAPAIEATPTQTAAGTLHYPFVVTPYGLVNAGFTPGGGGGGSQTPWTGPINGAGNSLTNVSDGTFTNTVNTRLVMPFQSPFRVILIGDSGGLNPSINDNFFEYMRTNYFIKSPFYRGSTNLSVSGEALGDESWTKWSSTYSAFATAGGTNAYYIINGGYNDIKQGTNIVDLMNSASNLLVNIRASGSYSELLDSWGKMDENRKDVLAKYEDFVKTNIWCDFRAMINPTWSYASGGLSIDGKHPNDNGTIAVGNQSWLGFWPGYQPWLSGELHIGGFIDQYLPANPYNDAGLSYSSETVSDAPYWRFRAMNGANANGMSQIGTEGGKFRVWNALGANNLSLSFESDVSSNISLVPLYANAIYATSNAAPFTPLTTTEGNTSWGSGRCFTNGPTAAWLMMDCSLVNGASGSADQVFIHYTNNAVHFQRQVSSQLAPSGTTQYIIPVQVPLNPGATFEIDEITSTGGSINLLNQQLVPR